MARGATKARERSRPRPEKHPLAWAFTWERVTGIEPALSAWESDRSGPLTALTWATDVPLVTVMHPAAPGLMARQWPADRLPWCRRSRCASGGMSVLNPAWRSPAVGGNWCSSSRPTLDVGLVPVSQPPQFGAVRRPVEPQSASPDE